MVQHGNRETAYKNTINKKSSDPTEVEEEDESQTFKKSEKAAQASQINLSAKLSSYGKDGEGKTGGGRGEVRKTTSVPHILCARAH